MKGVWENLSRLSKRTLKPQIVCSSERYSILIKVLFSLSPFSKPWCHKFKVLSRGPPCWKARPLTFRVTCGCFVKNRKKLYGCDSGDWKAESSPGQDGKGWVVWPSDGVYVLRASLEKTMDISPANTSINKKGSTKGNIDGGRGKVGIH